MHRNALRRLLAAYPITYPDDQVHLERVQRFVEQYPQCFDRSLTVGHITGSAWLLDPSSKQLLLTHHKKLDIWVQLGGHSDGDPDTRSVALREAEEESGLAVELLDASILE